MASDALELRQCIAPEAVSDAAREEHVPHRKEPLACRTNDPMILGAGPQQLEDRWIRICCESEELPQLIADVIW
jgi:hypothetical protein